jgi:hypothetical protein
MHLFYKKHRNIVEFSFSIHSPITGVALPPPPPPQVIGFSKPRLQSHGSSGRVFQLPDAILRNRVVLFATNSVLVNKLEPDPDQISPQFFALFQMIEDYPRYSDIRWLQGPVMYGARAIATNLILGSSPRHRDVHADCYVSKYPAYYIQPANESGRQQPHQGAASDHQMTSIVAAATFVGLLAIARRAWHLCFRNGEPSMARTK